MSSSSNPSSTRPGAEGSKPPSKKKPFDLVRRGAKRPTPLGTATFIGLRLADIPWQYHLLHSGAAERALFRLGLPALGSGFALFRLRVPEAGSGSGFALRTGLGLVDALELPWPRLLLLGMAAGASAKQIVWLTCLSQEEFPVGPALAVSAYNTAVNSANALLFACAYTSAWGQLRGWRGPRLELFGADVPLSVVAGALAYAAGITIETLSEVQRSRFKRDPRNQGMVCRVGLWRWARHINYLGYALWRGGYAMAAGGWIAGLAMGLWQGWDLSTRAVAALDAYCADRYGAQWTQFKQDVPYKIIPGVY